MIGANTGVYELSIDGVSEGLYCLINVMLLWFFQADRDAIELFFMLIIGSGDTGLYSALIMLII